MTLDVRTRGQEDRLSSGSRSPSPKRSRNDEEHPKLEEAATASVEDKSPKPVSPVEDTVEEATIIPASEDISITEENIKSPSQEKPITFSEVHEPPIDVSPPSEVASEDVTEEPEANNKTDEAKIKDEANSHTEDEEQPNLSTPEQDENDDGEDNKIFSFPSLVDPKDKKLSEERKSPEVIQIDDENTAVSLSSTNGPQLPKLSTLETGKESEFHARRRPPFRRPVIKRRRRQCGAIPEPIASPKQQLQSQSPINQQQQLLLAQQQANLIRKPLTPIWNMIRNFPKEISNDYPPFYAAMCQWKWEMIDEIKIPVIFRDSQILVAHSVAHIKLFSKFPTNVSSLAQHLPADVTLESIPMTETEAWMMNFINTIVGNYELGMQIFQNGDSLVELHAIELYYFFAKKHYLEDLLRIYDGAVPQEALTECKNIIGAILNLKKKILDDLKKINEQIKIKYRPQNQSSTNSTSYFPTPTLLQNQIY